VRRRDAGVGADQEFLEFLPELVVDLPAVKEAGDAAEPAFPRPFQRVLGLFVGLLGALEDTEQRGTSLVSRILSVRCVR